MPVHDPAPGHAPRPRILVVDADERVRESLAGLLAIGDQVEVVGSAGDAVGALALIPTARPDLIVVDPRLPEVERGVAFIDAIRREAPGVKVLVMHWSDVVEECLDDCHPDALVRKTFRPSELLAAIQAACAAPPAH
jgi:DNA-binding NarL/FixJ family response regulator